MGRRKKEKLELRFYEIPKGESVLALVGDDWVGRYGQNDVCKHFHNLFEIGYCHYGNGLLILGEREHVYEDGMVSAIPANFPHITVSEGEDFWEFLFFDPGELIARMYPGRPKLQAEKLALLSRDAGLFSVEEQPELAATVRKILREMREKKPYYRETVYKLMQICLLELLRVREEQAGEELPSVGNDVGAMGQILPALAFIDAHYAENIRASQLAARCGLSEAHFRRLFEERVHMPPMDYLNRIRVQKACQLLNRRDCAMDVVAEECGFSSLSAFNRNFKKFMDSTPYQWKRSKNNYQRRLQEYSISKQKGWEGL